LLATRILIPAIRELGPAPAHDWQSAFRADGPALAVLRLRLGLDKNTLLGI
jgi:hypothetical protein